MKDCEECVYYHLERCEQEQMPREQVLETLQVALVGAGSVAVPLLRRAIAFMDQLPGLAALRSDGQQRRLCEPMACLRATGLGISAAGSMMSWS